MATVKLPASRPRKPWSKLADSTKKKFTRAGITPALYNYRYKDIADLRATAMGKAPLSYAMQRARETGIREAFPEFNMLPRAQKARLADQFNYATETRKMVKGRAEYYGIDHIVPPFEHMPADQQDQIADLYLRVMDLRNAGGHINMDEYRRAKLQLMGTLDSMGYDIEIPDRGLLGELYTVRF